MARRRLCTGRWIRLGWCGRGLGAPRTQRGVVAGSGSYGEAGAGGLDDDLTVGAVAGGVGGLIRKLVEGAKVTGYFGEVLFEIGCVKVEGLASGLGGEVIEGAHAVAVAGVHLSVLQFGVADGVDEDVGVLCGFDRVEAVVFARVFFAVAEDDEDFAAMVDAASFSMME
jgi:hypothetical protein